MGEHSADGRILFDNYIKIDWPREVKEAGVKKKDNSAYVPVARNVSLLREDVNAFDEAIRIWREDGAEIMSPGYRAIVDQVGIEQTWEYQLVDPGRPWETDVPADIRERVEKALGPDLEALNRQKAAERERIEKIRGDVQAGRRARIKWPGE